MLPIHTILHATDFSQQSSVAFTLACSLAKDYRARLILLHVAAPPIVVYGDGIVPPQPGDTLDFYREKLLALKPRDANIAFEHIFVEGDAADEIVRIAADHKCDVIFMGTHGRTGLTRLVMGSVAENVLRHATCPVVTVRMPLPETIDVEEAEVESGAELEAGVA